MSTATADTTPIARAAVGYHDVPLTQLIASSLNPRKRVSHVEDLAASIREVGLLEPLLVRPTAMTTDEDAPVFEVVAGGRRYAAASVAGLMLVPCLVRPLTDAQALELAIVENNQRSDVHPLEEAEAFAKIRTLDRAYTVEVLAVKIGRPVAYVRNRLRLLDLVEDVREAFADHEITIGHAERIARLPADLQRKALDACFLPLYGREDGGQALQAINALDDWITAHTVLDVKSAQVQDELPELVEQVERLEAEGATLVQLSTAYRPEHGLTGKAAPLPHTAWVEATKACAHAVQGVVVYGERKRAEILTVCLKKSKCPTHWPVRPVPTSSDIEHAPRTKQAWEIEADKRAAARKALDEVEGEILTAIAAHLKGRKVDRAYVEAVADRPSDRAELAKYVGAITPATVGQALWFVEVMKIGTYDPARWMRQVKDLIGFDPAAWMKARAKAVKPATSTPAAAKGTATKAKAKTKAGKRR